MDETKGLLWRAGLSVVAALMLSGVAYAQDASGDGSTLIAVDVVVQNWHDINSGTIDVVDPGVGDGTGDGTGAGTDPDLGDGTGDGTNPGVGDGSVPTAGGLGDGGAVTIYRMDGGPTQCIQCALENMASPGLVPQASQAGHRGGHGKQGQAEAAQTESAASVGGPSVGAPRSKSPVHGRSAKDRVKLGK